MINYQDLSKLFFFEALSPDQLKWVVETSIEKHFEPGEKLFNQGETAEAIWILFEGEWRLTRNMAGTETVLVTTSQPGTWVGGFTLLNGVYQATVTILKPTTVIYICNSDLKEMLAKGFPVALHLLNGMINLTRNLETQLSQYEKMASLGKLSAGLAHELNNPAAAGHRAAEHLQQAMTVQQELTLDLASRLDASKLGWLKTFYGEAKALSANVTSPGGLEQGEREDEMITWLENEGVDESWTLAPTLVEAGLELSQLEELKEAMGTDALGETIRWLEINFRVNRLLGQVEQSTRRISTLVKTVKNYSFMDQAPSQEIDVHECLENSLGMLGHKLKPGISIKREYASNLPRITAFGSELNQVWTNLLDNAIDALKDQGQVTIRTWGENKPDQVIVEISDTGHGIPSEIQSRIFEPFFTTKGVGQGTGLGLDIVYKIVVTNHKGDIKVTSQPGQTTFRVILPSS